MYHRKSHDDGSNIRWRGWNQRRRSSACEPKSLSLTSLMDSDTKEPLFSDLKVLHLVQMHAELQVLSPLVAVREVYFLRFCKQHAEGVTWVEHAEYEDGQVHQLYRPLLRSGLAFGAGRWVATLQRQCEGLAILMSSAITARDETGNGSFIPSLMRNWIHSFILTDGLFDSIWIETITASGRRSMLKLAQRMTNAFCAGVCASSAQDWSKLATDNVGEEVRVMTRMSVNEPGEPAGVVLSAATSVWIPVPPKRLFDFLREASFRSKWDILSNGGPMYEMAHIAKGQDAGNAVSLLRASVRYPPSSSPPLTLLGLHTVLIDDTAWRAGPELQPNQHAHTAGDLHRRVRRHGGVRAGGHPSHAPRNERRRLRLRRPPPLRLRHLPRRCRRAAPDQRQPRVASERGVPDPGEQPADGEVDDGVGGDRQRPHLLHRPEDQGCTPLRRRNPPHPLVQTACSNLMLFTTVVCSGEELFVAFFAGLLWGGQLPWHGEDIQPWSVCEKRWRTL
ncbi:hypothetical protein BHE74_00045777 [Ensete ventricosum]|nr:hypothetical protein BHE74_00045777 [Ensete ventricosum]